jgi:hypothetical protein
LDSFDFHVAVYIWNLSDVRLIVIQSSKTIELDDQPVGDLGDHAAKRETPPRETITIQNFEKASQN